jgi:class 3 adenylate cyclase
LTILSGAFALEYPDGTRTELHAGDVYDMPPGHDGYVVGDDPVTVIEWGGVRAFNSFRASGGRRLLTLLITDLVDSTPAAARLGDSVWRELLSTHYEMARVQLERFAGREVKTTGDGMLAIFDGPAQALRCAAAIRERTNRERLRVRAGVHVGEVDLVAADVRGVAVHEVARIMNAAGPDEVLVSETTRTSLSPPASHSTTVGSTPSKESATRTCSSIATARSSDCCGLRADESGCVGDDAPSPVGVGDRLRERQLGEGAVESLPRSDRPHSRRRRAAQIGASIRSWIAVACAKASSASWGLPSLLARTAR